MALFWSKKPKAEKNYEAEAKKAKALGARNSRQAKAGAAPTAAKADKAVAIPSGRFDSATSAIIRPHVTEKTGILSQQGVYTFAVSKDANKPAIAKAVKHLYKVTPTRIAVVNLPAKQIFAKGKWGMVAGVRKAIVTVKKGDKIDFV
jgi:large subunit ribosomal protein L23